MSAHDGAPAPRLEAAQVRLPACRRARARAAPRDRQADPPDHAHAALPCLERGERRFSASSPSILLKSAKGTSNSARPARAAATTSAVRCAGSGSHSGAQPRIGSEIEPSEAQRRAAILPRDLGGASDAFCALDEHDQGRCALPRASARRTTESTAAASTFGKTRKTGRAAPISAARFAMPSGDGSGFMHRPSDDAGGRLRLRRAHQERRPGYRLCLRRDRSLQIDDNGAGPARQHLREALRPAAETEGCAQARYRAASSRMYRRNLRAETSPGGCAKTPPRLHVQGKHGHIPHCNRAVRDRVNRRNPSR
jgi:hypothetical protein